jgi:putative membrane protein
MAVPTLLGLLHAGASFSWLTWSIHPSTVIGLIALGALYEWQARRIALDVDGRQRSIFYAGLVTIFFSLNGPLHDLSDAFLFSAHMVQHLVLTLVVPPLLIAGTPGELLRPALGIGWVNSLARTITRPLVCFAIFNITIAAWHLPPAYNAAMAHHWLHIIQHLSFMVVAVLMWWPLMSPLPELPRLSYPAQLLYCFLLGIPMSIVAISITYARDNLYPAYASAPRMWGLSPMEDQMLGGLIMWIPGGFFFVAVMSWVFYKWQKTGEDDAASAQADRKGFRV